MSNKALNPFRLSPRAIGNYRGITLQREKLGKRPFTGVDETGKLRQNNYYIHINTNESLNMLRSATLKNEI